MYVEVRGQPLFYHASSGYWTQIVRLGRKHLYVLSHLASPLLFCLQVCLCLCTTCMPGAHRDQKRALVCPRTGSTQRWKATEYMLGTTRTASALNCLAISLADRIIFCEMGLFYLNLVGWQPESFKGLLSPPLCLCAWLVHRLWGVAVGAACFFGKHFTDWAISFQVYPSVVLRTSS